MFSNILSAVHMLHLLTDADEIQTISLFLPLFHHQV